VGIRSLMQRFTNLKLANRKELLGLICTVFTYLYISLINSILLNARCHRRRRLRKQAVDPNSRSGNGCTFQPLRLGCLIQNRQSPCALTSQDRLRAFLQHEIYSAANATEDQPPWAWSIIFHRRHLTPPQRGVSAGTTWRLGQVASLALAECICTSFPLLAKLRC
jgi:hypothetical protein